MINNHFKHDHGIVARQEYSSWRTQTINNNQDKIIELRKNGKTVTDIAKAILGNDLLKDVAAIGRFIDTLPSRRLRNRYG